MAFYALFICQQRVGYNDVAYKLYAEKASLATSTTTVYICFVLFIDLCMYVCVGVCVCVCVCMCVCVCVCVCVCIHTYMCVYEICIMGDT